MKKYKFLQSEIRRMSLECEKVDGINLSQGVSNRKLNNILQSYAIKSIKNGHNQYSRYDGIEKLKLAVKEKLFRYNKLDYKSIDNIVVTSGATGAFYSTLKALFNKKDEIILFEPFYGYHLNTVISLDLVPKFLNLNLVDYKFHEEDLTDIINANTKALVLCSPSNPSGKVFSKEEIRIISKICNENNIIIITDEIYEYFIYDNHKHISPGSLDSNLNNTITISGFSKTFSITGWRIGYVACKKGWAQLIGYVNDLIYVCAPTPFQIAVAEGICHIENSFYESLKKQFQIFRDDLCQTLLSVGLKPIIPQGSYYILADVSNLEAKTSKEAAMYILNKTGVATVPGSAFYKNRIGEKYVRFCFSVENQVFYKACSRIRRLA